MPTMRTVELEKSVGDLPLLPYSSMFNNAFVWVAYGLLRKEKKVWATNSVGMMLGLAYCNIFRKYASRKASNLPGTLSNHFQATVLILLLTSACAVMLPVKLAAQVVGLEGVAFCVLLFASPLASLKHVVQSKSAKTIPLPFTLACIINCFCWSAVGYFEMKDFMIYFPNALGLMFGLVQLLLRLKYGDGKESKGSSTVKKTATGLRGGAFVLPV